jgi:3-phenylpropionate/trans-cinnamate dioxygenase ferredoxin subunit
LLSCLLFAATVIWCKRPSLFYEDCPDVSEFIEVSRITEFREGQMKKVKAGSQELLLARVKERFYAFDARCPHLDGDLSKGTLADTTLTCPVHHSQFDIRDGHVIRWTDLTGIRLAIASRQHPPRSLHHYTVRVEGDKILVSL